MLRSAKRIFGLMASRMRRAWLDLTDGSWNLTLLEIVAVSCTLVAAGLLYAWLGLVPVAASEGHWPITQWFLRFTMRNSVELSATGIKPPPLDDPALVLKAAGHYATGCAPCHGAPGEPRSPIVQRMVPEPPSLAPKIQEQKPEHLFWIVKHGIKYTAMPGWVALKREDEIWAMVAFLLRLPELSHEEYRRLAYGEQMAMSMTQAKEADALTYLMRPLSEPLDVILMDCARCHGPDGNGRGLGAFPKLSGQSEDYLLASLQAFAKGKRHSGIMEPVAAGLSEETLRTLARHYSRLAQSPSNEDSKLAEALERGRRIAELGIPEQGIPSCVDCHGPQSAPRNPMYPELAGQYADYLVLQLKLFKNGTRGGTPYAHIMNAVAGRLTQEQILDIAHYYASIAPESNTKADQ